MALPSFPTNNTRSHTDKRMTFSLVARCKNTGMLGMAISSSSPAVAARCTHTRAGVGAVASQNVTDPALGPALLDLLSTGLGASDALTTLLTDYPYGDWRQLLVVDATGTSAIHSGPRALGVWGEAQGHNVAAGGNLLDNVHVPQAMVDAFIASSGHLGDRLIGALTAGRDAGGEAGPVHSAGLQVVDAVSWPVVDLRSDWSESCPVDTVAEAGHVYKPQLQDYVIRALNPDTAPSYGVPGDQ